MGPRLLFIGAHPDDETFFAAGSLARYAADSTHVAVLCATRGHEGKTGDVCRREDLPRVREAELHCAMRALGVDDITVLDYQDKHLLEAPIEEMRRHLVCAVRRVRPSVVITFDPHGGNQHPDHIAISRFTSDALAIAPDPRWYSELGEPFEVSRLLWTPPVFVHKLTESQPPHRQPGFDFIIDVSRYVLPKSDAFRAHATQFPGLKKLFFDHPDGQRNFHLEAFRLASGRPPAKLPCDDLFADLEEED